MRCGGQIFIALLYGKVYVRGRHAQVDGAGWARFLNLCTEGYDDEGNEYDYSGYGNARGDMGGVILAGGSAVYGFLCDAEHDRRGSSGLRWRDGYLCRNNHGRILFGVPGYGCVVRAALREPAVLFQQVVAGRGGFGWG